MSDAADPLIDALRKLPAPEPRAGFVDRAIAAATREPRRRSEPLNSLRAAATRWETWFGAAVGGAMAAALTLFVMQAHTPGQSAQPITLALHEARAIDVLIQSDRDLQDATIRIAVTGGVALDGFANDHIVDWRADLQRGANLVSLPVVARTAGAGQLVAVIEHEGRARSMMINLKVNDAEAPRS